MIGSDPTLSREENLEQVIEAVYCSNTLEQAKMYAKRILGDRAVTVPAGSIIEEVYKPS